jgi:hypothetical protein
MNDMANKKATEGKNVSAEAGIATTSENQKLEHPQGGITTRDDILDLGVPMLPGSENERQGPEDALGEGPKRGDYTNRLGGSTYHPHEALPVKNAAPGEPTVRLEAQRPRAEDIGDAEGLKGGVETANV